MLWSTSSVASNWVRDEATEGTQRNILVPGSLIDEAEIPLGFRQHQTVDLRDPASEQNPSAFDDLVAAVDSVLRRSGPKAAPGQPPQAAAIPAPANQRTAIPSGTVPRSFLYAALGIAAVLALVVTWQALRSGTTPQSGSEPRSTSVPGAGPLPANPAEAPVPTAVAPSPPAAAAASGGEVSDSPAEAAGIVVSGKSQDYYSVLDAGGTNQLGYVLTGRPVDLFPGNYLADLHGVRRSVTVAAGRRTSLLTGTISVSGTGKDYFAVLDASGTTQLGYLLTSRALELFPGEYRLTLHGARSQRDRPSGARNHDRGGANRGSGLRIDLLLRVGREGRDPAGVRPHQCRGRTVRREPTQS